VARSESPQSTRTTTIRSLIQTLLVLAVLAGGLFSQSPAWAAQTPDEAWTPPVNLSNSGGTANPNMIVNSTGDLQVLWDELYGGNGTAATKAGYVRLHDGVWGNPVHLALPITGRPSQLLVGPGDFIYAFWIATDNSLLYKRVAPFGLGSTSGLSGAIQLASSVAAFHAAIDGQGRVHLAYVRFGDSPNLPPGIYYQKTGPGGQGWSSPLALYTSGYLRRFASPRSGPLSALSGDVVAHVDLLTTEVGKESRVYVAWDNPSLKRIFVGRSSDGGVTWSPETEVAGPDTQEPYASPRKIVLSGQGESLLLLWQRVFAGGTCAQVFQTSDDGGATWGPVGPALGGLGGCPDSLQSLTSSEKTNVFFAVSEDQAYLIAWDGHGWSQPQPQEAIDSFVNPNTYNYVNFGCRQAAVSGKQLFVVGCDEGEGGDIWLTSLPLGSTTAWFSPNPGWKTDASAPLSEGDVLSLSLAADSRGVTHSLVSQATVSNLPSAASAISYTALRNDVTGPFVILPDLPGRASPVSLLVDADDRLLALWSEGTRGELAFSWTSSPQASARSGWYDAQMISEPAGVGQSPAAALGAGGEIFVAFAIPVNEQRGIYLVGSKDHGLTWTPPVRIFDAVAGECEMVEHPGLAVGPGNILHVIWTCSTLPGGLGPLNLSYSRSIDGGMTWSQPQILRDQPVGWSSVAATGSDEVHVLWQEGNAGRSSLWDARSLDAGMTWLDGRGFSAFEGQTGPTVLLADRVGQLHLLQAVADNDGQASLRYFLWTGAGWTGRDRLPLQVAGINDIQQLAASMNTYDRLVVAYTALPRDTTADPVRLVFASIPVRMPSRPASASSTEAVASPTALTPETTATPSVLPGAFAQGVSSGSVDQRAGTLTLIGASALAILFLLGLAVVWLRRAAARRQG